jgi:pyruvate/2-oxoglutarate dehydrogenase complex dihydrolipoamide dehydrogenase (E3) component
VLGGDLRQPVRGGDHLEVDAVLTFLGFKPDLGPLKRWGLELEGNRVVVDRLMRTNLPGVYAVGDMVSTRVSWTSSPRASPKRLWR